MNVAGCLMPRLVEIGNAQYHIYKNACLLKLGVFDTANCWLYNMRLYDKRSCVKGWEEYAYLHTSEFECILAYVERT